MGKILALDYGEKRIGLAVTDETKKVAFPKPYLLTKEKEKLLDFIKNKEVEEILLGLPKTLSGREGQSTKKVHDFAGWLKKRVNLPITFIDERFTTREALSKLKYTKRKIKELKAEVDSMSALLLLQSYLKKRFRN